jgi:hypothetical protein
MVVKFIEESKKDQQQILVDKLRLLEKENISLYQELEAAKNFHESREQEMQNERA